MQRLVLVGDEGIHCFEPWHAQNDIVRTKVRFVGRGVASRLTSVSFRAAMRRDICSRSAVGKSRRNLACSKRISSPIESADRRTGVGVATGMMDVAAIGTLSDDRRSAGLIEGVA